MRALAIMLAQLAVRCKVKSVIWTPFLGFRPLLRLRFSEQVQERGPEAQTRPLSAKKDEAFTMSVIGSTTMTGENSVVANGNTLTMDHSSFLGEQNSQQAACMQKTKLTRPNVDLDQENVNISRVYLKSWPVFTRSFSFLHPLLATPLPPLVSAPSRPSLPLEKCSIL